MNAFRLAWWRLLMDLRPVVRYFAERFPHLASQAVRVRSIAHVVVGNPGHVLVSLYGLTVWVVADSFRWGFTAWLTTVVAVELGFQFLRARGGCRFLLWLLGWREAWRVRRRWPADWAMVAAKTSRVQAEVGTSKEPVASARLRPIADHPKMSCWPSIAWPVVSWWVGPPPGRSFAALDEVAPLLAANISHCIDVAIDFDRESDSYGRLVVTFDDPLADTLTPAFPAIDVSTGWPEFEVDPDPMSPRLVPVPDGDVDGWEGF